MTLDAYSTENQSAESIMPLQGWVDGQWQNGQGASFDSHSPCERFKIAQGHTFQPSQVEQAVLAANQAWRGWRRTPLIDREGIVRQFQQIVRDRAEELALLISRETGKPLWESKTEAAAVAGKVDLAIAALHERRATQSEDSGAQRTVTRFHSQGVLAVLGPFNFPAHLPNGHIVPALLAGNTLVFKPSELTPTVGQWMAAAWEMAGLPSGVLNLVQGGRETGAALVADPNIHGLLFTGSSNAGSYFHRQFSAYPEKILALEMGGNNPLVVSDVQDREAAVYQILLSAFLTAGQRCTCARRLILVQQPGADDLLDLLVHRAQGIRTGWFDDPSEPFMGTVISSNAGDDLRKGWELLSSHGGRSRLEPTVQRDCPALLSPGIIEMPEARTYEDREWFGPMLQVFRVANLEQAIQLANDTRYGLSAGLLSDSANDWEEFIQEIRAGVVNWNRQTTGASGKLPFGGCGLSGNHRPSGYYAADYCSFPVASIESTTLELPEQKMTGLAWD